MKSQFPSPTEKRLRRWNGVLFLIIILLSVLCAGLVVTIQDYDHAKIIGLTGYNGLNTVTIKRTDTVEYDNVPTDKIDSLIDSVKLRPIDTSVN